MTVTKPEHDQQSNMDASAITSGFGQSSLDPYALSSNDDEYLTPKCMAEMPPGWTDRVARVITAARL